MKTVSCLLAALAFAGPAFADEQTGYLGDKKCRIAPLDPPPSNFAIQWKGDCVDGYAEGKGTLIWSLPGKPKNRADATLVRGQITGEATLQRDGYTYTGPLKDGREHGLGFSKSDTGELYEGEFVEGRRHGQGIELSASRSRYEGQWKDGRKHGFGRATFSLGGSYEGEFKDGKFHGKGTITYAGSGHRYEGEFADGRVAGVAPLETPPETLHTLRGEIDAATPGYREHLATTNSPHNVSWDKFTPGQQNSVKMTYPALEHGDEPPYPAQGIRPLAEIASRLREKLRGPEGTLRMHVLVGADGLAKSVTNIGSPNPELARHIAQFALTQKYKPAVCRGQPCEMIYSLTFQFERSYEPD